MKLWLCRFTVLALLGPACPSWSAQETDAPLLNYRCSVVMESSHRMTVSVVVRQGGVTDMDRLTSTLVRYDREQIDALQATDEENRPISFTQSTRGRVTTLALSRSSLVRSPEGETTYTLRYRVQSSSGDLLRIPLPVPDAKAVLGQRAVEIEIQVPPNYVAAGDQFPAFVWTKKQMGRVRLPGVPSFVMARIQEAEEVSWRSRMMTLGHFSDVVIVSLVLLGSVIWRRRYRFSRAVERR